MLGHTKIDYFQGMFDEEMHSMLDIALCLGLVEIILGLAYIRLGQTNSDMLLNSMLLCSILLLVNYCLKVESQIRKGCYIVIFKKCSYNVKAIQLLVKEV